MATSAFFYNDKHGNPQDASLHDELLNNPEVEDRVARNLIQSSVDDGMSLEEAVSLLGTDRIKQRFEQTGSIE